LLKVWNKVFSYLLIAFVLSIVKVKFPDFNKEEKLLWSGIC
jgi:hypothetical protein